MTKNYLNILILAFLSAFSINQLSAQEENKEVKVVVIEKTVDKDGNESVKKVIKEGEDAKVYVQKIDKEIKIKKKANGEKEMMKQVRIDGKEGKKVVVIKTDGDNVEKEIEWISKGGDMPEDIEVILEEHDIDVEVESDGEHRIRVKVMTDGDEEMIFIDESHEVVDGEYEVIVQKAHEERKAQLGVMIKMPEEGEGIEVIDVFEGSGAEAAGIKSGDLITMVNETAVKSIEDLVDAVKDREPGEKVKLQLVRDNEPTVRSVKLQEYSPKHDKHEEHEVIIIKKEH